MRDGAVQVHIEKRARGAVVAAFEDPWEAFPCLMHKDQLCVLEITWQLSGCETAPALTAALRSSFTRTPTTDWLIKEA